MTDVQENVLVDQTVSENGSNGVVNQSKSPEANNDQNKSADLKNLSEEERLKLRMKKFGAQSDQNKKEQRAARFGTPATATSGGSATADPSVLEKRAQRFGASAPSTPVAGASKELLEKRAKRFGVDAAAAAATESNGTNKPSDEVLAKRKERFGEANSNEDDAKKKLRQQRFQNTA